MLSEKLLGDWLGDSGWIEMLTITEVTIILCRAEVYNDQWHTCDLKARFAHQITVLSLLILQTEAYLKHTNDRQENDVEIQLFEAWSNQREKT